MTVTYSIVPTLTRADLLRIAAWTQWQQHVADEYAADPMAASKVGTGVCSRCREGKHYRCPAQARGTGGLAACRCWIDDHTRRTA